MARKELSKTLIPCRPELQKELLKKHGLKKGFFYSNEAGELFCAVSKACKEPGEFEVAVLKIEGRNRILPHYKGDIFFVGKDAIVAMGMPGTQIGFEHLPPPKSETGRQVFRIVIEEALRLGAEKVSLRPANKKLGKYYRKTFGFRKFRKVEQKLVPKTSKIRALK